ncbi:MULTISPECIES: hypothetical protein [Mesorhizobium]|uniref:hypothetical protein n=1 Tax=Mesorhizobium TaxID=68287 RepID=UPI000A45D1EC|nr:MULTISPECIES: hypothetical protein [Mesorhizobium]MCA0002808.1 hypothetical protein [Mesorhizobium sp. B264B2A]MCA0009041.1 hypothetical protein [Mesorhizobium sp. B264B1B]MCA0014562.1 hypothetical protein [Mesorhizobium sp. B294B1A1]MCA0018181.1 hypothetical protein [Mesorhizobium sp. B264B1A]MCA0033291.1 hypothetical protein [Mesorhizobium sp. B263B2A]
MRATDLGHRAVKLAGDVIGRRLDVIGSRQNRSGAHEGQRGRKKSQTEGLLTASLGDRPMGKF